MTDPQAIPRLNALATAVPPFVLHRGDVMRRALTVFHSRADEIRRLLPVYDNAGIDTRHSCMPLDWYERPVGWAERNRLFIDNALTLLDQAARLCLERAGVAAAAVDAVVCVSSSGIAAPSLEARLLERLGLRCDVMRLPVFGLGCAGGALGLARAAAMARAHPGARVLFLVVELCGLTFRARDMSKSNIIATALFGDGAAAALISSSGGGARLSAWGEHTWPASLDVMGWRVEEDGLAVMFSSDIPVLVRSRLRAAVEAFLERHGLGLAGIDRVLFHPGGAKVVEALEQAFGLAPGSMGDERAVLARYGNMSAATLLFVLEHGLTARPFRRCLAGALRPGFSAGFLLLDPP